MKAATKSPRGDEPADLKNVLAAVRQVGEDARKLAQMLITPEGVASPSITAHSTGRHWSRPLLQHPTSLPDRQPRPWALGDETLKDTLGLS